MNSEVYPLYFCPIVGVGVVLLLSYQKIGMLAIFTSLFLVYLFNGMLDSFGMLLGILGSMHMAINWCLAALITAKAFVYFKAKFRRLNPVKQYIYLALVCGGISGSVCVALGTIYQLLWEDVSTPYFLELTKIAKDAASVVVGTIVTLQLYKLIRLNRRSTEPKNYYLLLIAFGILAASIVSYRIFVNYEKRNTSLEANEILKEVSNYLSERISETETQMIALGSAIRVMPGIQPNEFNALVSPLLEKSPWVTGFEWLEPVSGQEIEKYFAKMNDLYPKHISKKSFADKLDNQMHYFVTFIHSLENFDLYRFIGLDLSTDKKRLTLINNAIENRKILSSEPVRLLGDWKKKTGFLLFHPVFQQENPEKLLGLMGSIVRAEKFFDRYTDGEFLDLKMQLYSLYSDGTDKQLLYSNKIETKNEFLDITTTLPFSGRTLEIRLSPTKAFYIKHASVLPTVAPSVGLIVLMMLSFIAYILKISERRLKNINSELTTKTTQLYELNQAKSDFLAHMSHEMRTPMTSILGFVDILLEKDPNQSELRVIKRSGTHLLSIINDVLDLSKIEAGQFELQENIVHLKEIVSQVYELIEYLAQEKQVNFAIQVENDDLHFYGDSLRIKQVLINLLTNAVKFTKASGAVKLKIYRHNKNDQLHFAVMDTGKGISKENQKRLFKPFMQLQRNQQIAEGTGLGLTICQKLVGMMGGKIQVQSEVGIGSTFEFYIPLRQVEIPDSVAEQPVNKRPCVLTQKNLKGARVLVADDAPDIRFLLSRILESVGAEPILKADGLEALQYFESHSKEIDLILLDMQMPKLNGINCARKLRNIGCTLPVVAITANAMEEDRFASLNAGCDAYVTKPIEIDQFLKTLKNLLVDHKATH